MFKGFYRTVAKVRGRNARATPVSLISEQLNEPRPLPMGRQEFEDWSDRIISGALVSCEVESQKYALAGMIMHLGPTESHKPDSFFIHGLRKTAANQVAHTLMQEINIRGKARKAAEEAAAKA